MENQSIFHVRNKMSTFHLVTNVNIWPFQKVEAVKQKQKASAEKKLHFFLKLPKREEKVYNGFCTAAEQCEQDQMLPHVTYFMVVEIVEMSLYVNSFCTRTVRRTHYLSKVFHRTQKIIT